MRTQPEKYPARYIICAGPGHADATREIFRSLYIPDLVQRNILFMRTQPEKYPVRYIIIPDPVMRTQPEKYPARYIIHTGPGHADTRVRIEVV